jgi:hypothetical protein
MRRHDYPAGRHCLPVEPPPQAILRRLSNKGGQVAQRRRRATRHEGAGDWSATVSRKRIAAVVIGRR